MGSYSAALELTARVGRAPAPKSCAVHDGGHLCKASAVPGLACCAPERDRHRMALSRQTAQKCHTHGEAVTGMANALDVAAHIVAELGAPVTAMKLQKLVYYSYAWHLVWEERPLFPDRIEAWANGPVVPSLYDLHRGSFTVDPGSFPGGDPGRLTKAERESVQAVIDAYGGKSAHELSELTHSEAPWRATRERAGLAVGERGRAPISDADMFEFYDGLTAAATEA